MLVGTSQAAETLLYPTPARRSCSRCARTGATGTLPFHTVARSTHALQMSWVPRSHAAGERTQAAPFAPGHVRTLCSTPPRMRTPSPGAPEGVTLGAAAFFAACLRW